MPASNTNFVHFRIIENASETGANQYSGDFQGLYLAVEQLDDNFLEEHGLPDGNLYKMENGTGVGGIGGESNNQGDYPAVTDSSDLIAFKTTYQSATQTADWWRQNFNLESYYNYRSIVEAIHHYDIGGGKNYFYYLNPGNQQMGDACPGTSISPGRTTCSADGNEPFRNRVLAIPEFALRLPQSACGRLRDLLYQRRASRAWSSTRWRRSFTRRGSRRWWMPTGRCGITTRSSCRATVNSRQGGTRPVLRRRRRRIRPPAALPA